MFAYLADELDAWDVLDAVHPGGTNYVASPSSFELLRYDVAQLPKDINTGKYFFMALYNNGSPDSK